jgi:lipoprotein NlpD
MTNRIYPSTFLRATALLSATVVLGACATSKIAAPIEDRSGSRPTAVTQPGSGAVGAPAATSTPSGQFADKAGQPGFYTVKQGDTLYRISLDSGQAWRDVARWNNIENPNAIEVGQVLRVAPPPGEAVATRPVAPSKVESKPLTGASAPVAATPAASAPVAAAPAPAPAPAPQPASGSQSDEPVNWAWPASGQVVQGFDEAKNKGIDIAGKLGDPVLAAGDGRVVYAGSGLRGYGNLVIIKHNNVYLSAYAHNNALLVKEGDTVKRGQRIAEMGQSDAERVKLHFEIRRQGKPVDPSKWLPSR